MTIMSLISVILMGLMFSFIAAFTMPLFNWISTKFWNYVAAGSSKKIELHCEKCKNKMRITLYKRKQDNKIIICPFCKNATDISDEIRNTWQKEPALRREIETLSG